ncbi:MAG TPA: porin [Methylophilaceae bacterium]|jgi:phosphate-selective porin OprO/OprP
MQFKKKTLATLIATLAVNGAAFTHISSAYANDSEELENLRALVQQLDQKVKVLERKNEITVEDATAAKKEAPVVSAGPGGFSIKSADGNSELRLRGQIQIDARGFPTGNAFSSGNSSSTAVGASDTFLLKQFRPILQGKLWNKYDFLLTPDFGGGKTIVQDAYVDAKLKPWFQVKVGKQKTPFGLERLQGDADGKFIERGLPNNLVPNRDIGVQVHGLVLNDKVDYALGYFNGVIDGNSSDNFTTADTDNNRDKDIVARVFTTPFKDDIGPLQGLGFGLGVSYGDVKGKNNNGTSAQTANESNLPSFRSALGQLSVFSYRTAAASGTDGTYANGDRLRLSPQFYYYNGPFGLLGEYVSVEQDVSRTSTVNSNDSLSNDAWQIAASWNITGEDASYGNIVPKNPFNLDAGTWGAWELVARYGELSIDDKAFALQGTGTTAQRQARSYADPTKSIKNASAWATGVNWYLNRNTKIALDYEQTSYEGGWTSGSTGIVLDRPTERVLSSRLQLAF